MRKLIILSALFFAIPIFAQVKIGYINSEAIMKELPEAQDAQRKLDNLVQEWQAELRKLESEWKQKYDASF